eukprot:TRINITY_DN45255_c0_g1_i1.p2 TRINITY_DN45255_c0_g1~~TRINITY_DN45255_c0_g1_i1.p2  ORF type:complete len:117 (-),score=8.47 TRINITY_DN45255_c0_g1_i1:37-387(-)
MPRSTDSSANTPVVQREMDWRELPSAKGMLGKAPIELGNTNPERLHVKGNLKHVVAAKEEVIRLREIKKASEGAKRPRASTTDKDTGATAPKASLVKGRGVVGGRPAPQKGRRAEL